MRINFFRGIKLYNLHSTWGLIVINIIFRYVLPCSMNMTEANGRKFDRFGKELGFGKLMGLTCKESARPLMKNSQRDS